MMLRTFKKIRLAYLDDLMSDPETMSASDSLDKEYRSKELQQDNTPWRSWIGQVDSLADADPEYPTIIDKKPSQLSHAFRPFYVKDYSPPEAYVSYKNNMTVDPKYDFEDIGLLDFPGKSYSGWLDPHSSTREMNLDLAYEFDSVGRRRVITDSEDDQVLADTLIEAILEDYDWSQHV